MRKNKVKSTTGLSRLTHITVSVWATVMLYFNTLVLYGKIKPRSGRKRKRLLAFHAIMGHLDPYFGLRSHSL